MSHQTIHLLHLHGHGLNWLRVEKDNKHLRIEDAGEIEAAPREALDRWLGQPRKPHDAIRLYDSRSRYYSLVLRVPAAGLKQLEPAIKLRIRQELGVDAGELAWTARLRRDEDEQVHVEALVARREMLAEIDAWRQEHGLENLWVGADLSAIHHLAQIGRESNALIVNGGAHGATLYRVHPEVPVQRVRIGRQDETTHLPPGFERGGEQTAMNRWHYGEDTGWLDADLPALGAGEPAAPPRLHALNGNSPARLQLAEGGPAPRDAVLAGAVATLLFRHQPLSRLHRAAAGAQTAMPSMLPSAQGETFGEAMGRASGLRPVLSTRKAGVLCILLLVAFAGAFAVRHMIREQALTQLQTRARSLGVATGIYQAQDARLNEILARRGLLLPVFEAIHEAAPDGIQLTNIDMAAGGSLKISGKARGADKADEFFRGLAASPLLESVVMPEVVPVEREVQFEIVAMIRDRRGADRRRRL